MKPSQAEMISRCWQPLTCILSFLEASGSPRPPDDMPAIQWLLELGLDY